MPAVPTATSAISAEWLSSTLAPRFGSAVADVAITDIGEGTGIFGEIARLDLTYTDPEADLPASLIAKMPCHEPENLAVALALGLYEREVHFFTDIGPRTPLRIPRCHLAELDQDGRFVLLLEDLSVDYQVGDQIEGATATEARAAIDALAELHIRWWQDDSLAGLTWLPVPNAPAYMATVPDIYRAGLPVLEAEWADRLRPGAVDVARALDPRFEALMERLAAGPTTLSHADTRLDNIFFPADPTEAVAFIDFQLCMRQRGVCDLAYLIGTSVKAEEAREHWEALLRRWHGRITEAGIDYRWDDCIQHYREAALYYLCGAMSLIGSFDTGNERGAAMATAYTTRVFDHAVDIDAVEACP